MTLEQLVAFRAVARCGSFAKAAAELHKSQPAVSKLIQNLEAALGIVLFDRASYRARLSDAGTLFAERAALLLADLEELASFGRSLASDAEPVVRLVLEAVTPLPPLLEILRDVQAAYPGVRYELRTERLTGALEALRDDGADLAITSVHGLDGRIMVARAFRSVRIIPVVRHDHALARAGTPVPGEVLRRHPQVVLRDSARGELSQTMNVLEGGLRWTVTDVTAKLEIIDAGMGWGGLPEHVVAPRLRDGSLVALAIREFDVEAIELCVIRRRDRPHGPVAQALWSRAGGDAAHAPRS